MKVIDLLNKIANGERIPKTLRYKNNTYENEPCYLMYEAFGESNEKEFINVLNSTIEIIEEDKGIEEIKQMYEERDMYDFTFWESEFQTCDDLEKKIIDNIGLLRKKQEELIKAVNELKKGK